MNRVVTILIALGAAVSGLAKPFLEAELIFPLEHWHNHGSCIVETPTGEFLVCWFHGSGERTADDVEILGAKLDPSTGLWTKPFSMADTPGFPDTNCSMMIDTNERLWLLWPTILDNRWESALMKYKISSDYQRLGQAPVWHTEKVMHMKPGTSFEAVVRRKMGEYLGDRELTDRETRWVGSKYEQAADKLTRRLGWFTRAHPYIAREGRMIVGLYSDGFDFATAIYSDDLGKNWTMSEPMVGGGNIQPSFARKKNGTLVAYMRDNGPAPNRVHVAESTDLGKTWGKVHDHPLLPNPGAGLELMNLRDGRFLVIYNDTESGRHNLAVALSEDEGKTFRWKRYLQHSKPGTGSYHYPSIIQARDGTLHVTYSIFTRNPKSGGEGKSIKYAHFNLEWLTRGG